MLFTLLNLICFEYMIECSAAEMECILRMMWILQMNAVQGRKTTQTTISLSDHAAGSASRR